MGVMAVAEVGIDLACSNLPIVALNTLRSVIYVEVTKEGVQRGTNMVKRDMVEQQYNEVADELQKLQNIIC